MIRPVNLSDHLYYAKSYFTISGYVEGPNGEFDWCFTDQDYGMSEFFNRIDSLFIGRKSYELTQTMGDDIMPGFPKLTEYVFSNTLNEVSLKQYL